MSGGREESVRLPDGWVGARGAAGETTWSRRYAGGVVGQVIESVLGSGWVWSIVEYLPSGYVHVSTYGEAPTAGAARAAADSASADEGRASTAPDVLARAQQLIRNSDARELARQDQEQKHRARQVRQFIETQVTDRATDELTTMLGADLMPLRPLVWKLSRNGEAEISFDAKNTLEVKSAVFTPECVAELAGYAVAVMVDRRSNTCLFGLRTGGEGVSWARFASLEEFGRAAERAAPWDEVELSEY